MSICLTSSKPSRISNRTPQTNNSLTLTRTSSSHAALPFKCSKTWSHCGSETQKSTKMCLLLPLSKTYLGGCHLLKIHVFMTPFSTDLSTNSDLNSICNCWPQSSNLDAKLCTQVPLSCGCTHVKLLLTRLRSTLSF